MDQTTPEFQLFSSVLALKSQIEQLRPLTPSAPARQRDYHDYLHTLSKILPDAIPGPNDPLIPFVSNLASASLTGVLSRTAKEVKAERVKTRVDGVMLSADMPAVTPGELVAIIVQRDSCGDRAHCEDRALARLLRGYEHVAKQQWEDLLAGHGDPSPMWGLTIQRANDVAMVADLGKRLLAGENLMGQAQQHENGAGFLPFLFNQVLAIKWAKDWNEAPSQAWKTQVYQRTFQALEENASHFQGLSDDEKDGKMKDFKDDYIKFKRTTKGKNAAKQQLLAMYERFGPRALLDRYWDVRVDVEARTKDLSEVYQTLVAGIDERSALASSVVSTKDWNREVLLSVAEVLAGHTYGPSMREYLSEFLDDYPCTG